MASYERVVFNLAKEPTGHAFTAATITAGIMVPGSKSYRVYRKIAHRGELGGAWNIIR